MSDYERIAKLIRYLDENQGEQPSLGTLSEFMELSPHHLHRLFSNWAAITPKDFLQCLTVERAKRLLQEGRSVLDTSFEVGLSGPGRLHDLCVNLEAASPGEIKSGGAGWKIVYGFAESPFGRVFLAETPRGICELVFVDERDPSATLYNTQKNWSSAQFFRDDARVVDLAQKIFSDGPLSESASPLRALVRGTAFQVSVWKALVRIPNGSLVSYGHLAESIGKPKASRAVGSAVGRNDLAFLVPCHRVIRETGVVGDYRWGTTRKRAILAWESGVESKRYAVS